MNFTENHHISKYQEDTFYRSLLKSFSEDLPKVLTLLHEQFASHKYDLAKDLCHQMVGSSATYGYPAIARMFEILEKTIESGDFDQELIDTQLTSLERVCEKITTYQTNLIIE